MRRMWASLAVFVTFVLLGLAPGWSPQAHAATGERITDFTMTYAVRADGSVRVTEHITYQFAGSSSHGIKRNIVTRQGYNDSKDRQYELSGATASSPSGAPADLAVQDGGDGQTVLRIGSANRTVSGTQRYDIGYTLAHVVNAQQSDVEFYWNVLGTLTAVPVDHAKVTVTAPAASIRTTCWVGAEQSKQNCTNSSGAQSTYEASNIGPNQAMTVVAAYPTSAFTDTAPALVDKPGGLLSPDSSLPSGVATAGAVAGVGIPIAAAAGMAAMFWRRGRDERYVGLTPGLAPAPGQDTQVERGGKQIVAVQFQPPEGATPGLVGTIQDGRADTVDVSATIVDLAVRGYLRMEEIAPASRLQKSDWQLTRLRDVGDELMPYERTLFEGVFAGGDQIRLSDLRNHFSSTLRSAQSQLYDETVLRGWYRNSPQAVRAAYGGAGVVIAIAGIFAFMFVPILGIGVVLAGIIVALAGSRMTPRTASGSAVRQQALGFRRYMETAEANQIKFEEAEQIFSRYMPYAVVFGIAKQWAATFQRVAEAADAAGRPIMMPLWYIPIGGFGDFGSFGNIADGVSDFGTVASGTFTSTPGSSGGSGFSGGGGFAGGGGGGGGTGSW